MVNIASADMTLVPIDSSLFTWVSPYPGAATWSANNLTLHISAEPSTGGGAVTQTPVLPTSVLPQNIIGISFEISPSGAMMDFFSFGYLVRNYSPPGAVPDRQGGINLITSSGGEIAGTQPPMDNFIRNMYGLGGGRTNDDHVIEFLGADYSPLSLRGDNQNPLDSYPYFYLDFRAVSYIKPLDVTLSNINWIVECEPVPVPSAVILGSLGLTFSGWMLKRKRLI